MRLLEWIYRSAKKLKSGTEHLSYGRSVIRHWAAEAVAGVAQTPRILDVGCGSGDDLAGIAQAVSRPCELFGVENYPAYRDATAAKGVTALGVDIERETLPWDDGFFDLVSINQVLEHTKEIFWILGEISRVLKPGGTLIVGVPNLATWHDRLMLLLGMEPSSAHMLGGHIRAITRQGLRRVLEADEYWHIRDFAGSGFYPFPEPLARRLASWFPNLSTSIFFRVERTTKPGHFCSVLETRFFETNYYRGPKKQTK